MIPREARFVAMDFLSQVEHDPEAAAVLVTTDAELAQAVVAFIMAELPHLPRREIIEAALTKYSAVLLVSSWMKPWTSPTSMRPEHLQIVTRDPFALLPRIKHAGSIFLGPVCPGAGGRLRLRDQPRAAHGRLRPDVLRAVRGRFHQETHLSAPDPGGAPVPERYGHHPGRTRGPAPARPGRGRKVSR